MVSITRRWDTPAFGPLRLPGFRHLASAYTINQLGNWIGDVALAILVFDRTRSALATATLFLALRFIPALLGPLLAVRIETIRARVILPALHLGEAGIFAALALISHRFALAAVLLLAACDGMLAIAASALTRSATVALLAAEDLLREGNAILNIGFAAGGAIGPAIAGVLIASVGVGSALALDAVSFLAAAVFLATAGGLALRAHSHESPSTRLRAGLREVRSHRNLRLLVVAHVIAIIFFSSVIPIEVVFAERTLHAGATGYGWLLGAWGVGMVLGGVAFAAARRVALRRVLIVGTGLIAVGYAGLAAAPSLAIACAFSMVGGIGNGVQWIAVDTSIQQATSAPAMATVQALLASLARALPAVGFVLGGAVTALASTRAAYGIAAGGAILVLVAARRVSPQDLSIGRDDRAERLTTPVQSADRRLLAE